MRDGAVLHFRVFGISKNPVSFHEVLPVIAEFSRRSGFAAAINRRLRLKILEVLGAADRLNAFEIAGFAYQARRRICRHRPPRCSTAQLVATRRALRRLIAKGKVVSTGRYRRRKLYSKRSERRRG